MYVNPNKYQYHGSRPGSRRRVLFVALILAAGAAIVLSVVLFLLPALRAVEPDAPPREADLYSLWNRGMYNEVSKVCDEKLSEEPMDTELLMFYGFAQYYLAYFEKGLEEKIPRLDESIRALRRANLREADFPASERVDYVLGQAYYHKGRFYYDLAIKYIEKSLNAGYIGTDAYEYLGLAYGGLGDADKELEYFLKAAEKDPSDLLMLSVGKAYFKLNSFEQSLDYLQRSLNKTRDSNIEKECRFLMGEIYIQQNELLKAEEQYREIVELDPGSANAHFQLGEVYFEMNDIVRARSQWRKTLALDPTHHGAKLRYYK